MFASAIGRAVVFAEPGAVIGPRAQWEDDSLIRPGEEASQELHLPAGRWRLSIQYFSPVDLTLTGPGLEQPLKAALDGQRPNTISLGNDGQYWPAGEIEVAEDGPVRFTVRAAEPTAVQELTGWDGEASIGQIVAVADGPRETVPLRETCGHWLDHYAGARFGAPAAGAAEGQDAGGSGAGGDEGAGGGASGAGATGAGGAGEGGGGAGG